MHSAHLLVSTAISIYINRHVWVHHKRLLVHAIELQGAHGPFKCIRTRCLLWNALGQSMHGITQRDAARRNPRASSWQGHRIQRCYLPWNTDVTGHDDTSYPIQLLSNHLFIYVCLYSLQALSYTTWPLLRCLFWQHSATFYCVSEAN